MPLSSFLVTISALEIDDWPKGVALPYPCPGELLIDYISGYGVFAPVNWDAIMLFIEPEAYAESKLGSMQAVSGL